MSQDLQMVDAERMPEKVKDFKARSMQVRSRLGEQLYGLIERDLPDFYSKIRDVALGDSDDIPTEWNGKAAKSAASFLTNHRKMYIDLMKMANADVRVDEGQFQGDIETFKEQLSELSTDDLRKLVEAGVRDDDDSDD